MIYGGERMKKRGQALIEFIIILPILIFLILGIVDVGKIINLKNQLENDMDYVMTAFQEGQDLEDIQKTIDKKKEECSIDKQENFAVITLKRETTILTPGLNLILQSPYPIMVERMIPYES